MAYCYKQLLFTIKMSALQISNFIFMLVAWLVSIIFVLHIPLCCINTYRIYLNIRCEPFPNLSAEAQQRVTLQLYTRFNTFSASIFLPDWRVRRAVILCSSKYGTITGHHFQTQAWYLSWLDQLLSVTCTYGTEYWFYPPASSLFHIDVTARWTLGLDQLTYVWILHWNKIKMKLITLQNIMFCKGYELITEDSNLLLQIAD